jgi:hypothetical protein
MSNEKKPSIYQDRGTIGSARELDEYGVWVKSEPQDLVSGEADAGEDDFSLDKLPDFSTEFDSSPDLDFTIPEESFSAGDSEGGIGESGDLSDFSIDDFSPSGDEPGGGGENFALEGETDFSLGADSDAGFSPEELPDFSLSEEDLDFSLPEDTPALEAAAGGEPENPAPPESPANPESPDSGADDDEGFDEISLEDFLGGVADEFPGEEAPEEAVPASTGQSARLPDGEAPELPGGEAPEEAEASADRSTQLLVKIAEELSSIRAELSALKREFSAARGTEGENRGFFDEAGRDDKIALTGDELNNILNTADFTEETGADAAEGAIPDFPEGDTPGASEGVSPEISVADSVAELSLDEGAGQEEPAGELEVPADLEEPAGFGEFSEIETLGALETDSPESSGEASPELSLVDLSDDSINADFSIENGQLPEEEDMEIAELSPVEDSAIILEEGAGDEAEEDSGEPDISFDTPFPGEEITLDNFEEEALDLSGAVIEEPDLGAEIRENPVLEPSLDDIPMFDEGVGTPPARARGEDLDQIIPEGFVIGEPEDGGFGDLDPLEEGIPLEEIPEAVLPEEEEALEGGAEEPEEPEVSALPGNFKTELKQVLSYMDQLLESLPEEKIEEFAKSEYFDTYKKLFKDLGLA